MILRTHRLFTFWLTFIVILVAIFLLARCTEAERNQITHTNPCAGQLGASDGQSHPLAESDRGGCVIR